MSKTAGLVANSVDADHSFIGTVCLSVSTCIYSVLCSNKHEIALFEVSERHTRVALIVRAPLLHVIIFRT